MPLDGTGFVASPHYVPAPGPDDERDLALLRRGRYRIRDRWMWCKGKSKDKEHGPHCALSAAGGGVSIINLLRAQLPPGFEGAVSQYNDHHTTTHANVLALFDRAIAELERR